MATAKGNWFSRNWGWLVVLVMGVAGTVFGMRAWKRRVRTFVTEGSARYIGNTDAENRSHPWFNKVAYQFSSPSGVSGLAKGNTIDVKDPAGTGAFPTGEQKILDIHVQNDKDGNPFRWWVVTDAVYTDWKNGAHSGELQFVKA